MIDLKISGKYNGWIAQVARTVTTTSPPPGSFSDVLASAFYKGETGYDSYFDAAAKKYNISASLLKAVGMVESSFIPDAVSCCGAQGIMQLMPSTARSLGVADAFDPEQNIMGGAKYLSQMLEYYNGDVSLALAAYNAGPVAVDICNGVPSYCKNYVSSVLDYMDDFSDVPVSRADIPAASAHTSAANEAKTEENQRTDNEEKTPTKQSEEAQPAQKVPQEVSVPPRPVIRTYDESLNPSQPWAQGASYDNRPKPASETPVQDASRNKDQQTTPVPPKERGTTYDESLNPSQSWMQGASYDNASQTSPQPSVQNSTPWQSQIPPQPATSAQLPVQSSAYLPYDESLAFSLISGQSLAYGGAQALLQNEVYTLPSAGQEVVGLEQPGQIITLGAELPGDFGQSHQRSFHSEVTLRQEAVRAMVECSMFQRICDVAEDYDNVMFA